MTYESGRSGGVVQGFAFGGIANPTQRAVLRGSDRVYLDERQREFDAFEEQRQTYNDSLAKWQEEVYNPYKSKVTEYNTALQKYNTDVYDPYKAQFQKYQDSVSAYNEGPKTEGYSGPAEPRLASEFGLAIPTQPGGFGGTAPVAPTQARVDEALAYRDVAVDRARQDAGQRALAIDVVSNPDQFNFGSMSVSSPFMAKGGEVRGSSARRAMQQMLKEANRAPVQKAPIPPPAPFYDGVMIQGGTDRFGNLNGSVESRLALGRDKAAPPPVLNPGMGRGRTFEEPLPVPNPGPEAGGTFEGPLPYVGSPRPRQNKTVQKAIASNPNLSPKMLGGKRNAGTMYDRLGNAIAAPGSDRRVYLFAKGGAADLDAINAVNADTLSDDVPDEPINTDPVGSAKEMLSTLLAKKSAASPTRKAIKRTKPSPAKGSAKGSTAKMEYESLIKGDLGAMGTSTPTFQDTDPVQAQMRELGRTYQLKAQAAQDKSRGFSADTFGAPTLEQPTLTKGRLTKKRFQKGGEAKKPAAKEAQEPSIFNVRGYASDASERMFPEQGGENDQRDAARHMLAAAIISKKIGPDKAEFLGKAHERLNSPESFFSMLGIGKNRYDYDMDVHNNKLGAALGSRTTSQAELEKLVRAMALQSRDKQTEGKPWTMGEDQKKVIRNQGMTPIPPEYRAEGSPEEGELSQEEIDAASKPAFVTPSSGKGRKEGGISKQLKSGEAYVNVAKGLTEMPYNLAGTPMDLVMLARQGLTGQAPAGQVGTSDYIKSKMTAAGIRPEPPADPAAKGFYTAGDLLSNLANPASVPRKVGPAIEKGVKAGAMEVGRQLDRAIMDNAGPLAKAIPQSSKPLYAVRPTGSTMLSGTVGLEQNVSEIDRLLDKGVSYARSAAGQDDAQKELLKNFWDKKARNYFTRQFGTPDDPIMEGIKTGKLKGSVLSADLRLGFPEHLIDAMSQGKTRYREQPRPAPNFVGPGAPEGRFFPKFPESVEEFTQRYDTGTGLRGNVISADPSMVEASYPAISSEGRAFARQVAGEEADKLLLQGVRPELINTDVGTVARSTSDPEKVASSGTSSAKDLLSAYEEATAFKKMTPKQQAAWAEDQIKAGRGRSAYMDPPDVGPNLLPENVFTAIQKGEPVYDINYMGNTLRSLFDPVPINKYLAGLPARELANVRFEDAVLGGLKISDKDGSLKALDARIRAGKPVADKVFSEGVSKPLLQFNKDSGFDGFAWKRIDKREATVPEGAYIGHSVGGYEIGGPGYTTEKQNGFKTGKYRVYTLRDNRNRPVNTIEVKMLDENTPLVMQIKGNGRATGNTAPEKYDGPVLRFLSMYLKPRAIHEEDRFLTPLLQSYKEELARNTGL